MDVTGKVRQYIKANGLLQRGDRVIVGVSGGADSVCLLLCLCALRREEGWEITALHVHHGIRVEAEEDVSFCRHLCETLDVPFRLVREDVPAFAKANGLSSEEAGRILRYRHFAAERKRLAAEEPGRRIRIAVAHHLDDQAETVLLNLCRGTGIRGLGGMPPQRDGIVRPLLCCRRAEITGWLSQRGQPYREDATNREDTYRRNRVRHHLLPWMEAEVNARSAEHISALAEQARELDEYLEAEASGWLKKHLAETEGNVLSLPAAELAGLPGALRERVIHRALTAAAGAGRDITLRHIRAVAELVGRPVGSRSCLPYGVTARREYQTISLHKGDTETKYPRISAEFSVFPRKTGKIFPEKLYTKWFDYDKIKNNAVLRTRRTGDKLRLAGVGTKSVKSYMIDAKIPAGLRNQIPVLADGDEVMWVVGYRMSAAYQITEETKTILEVTVHFPDSEG